MRPAVIRELSIQIKAHLRN